MLVKPAGNVGQQESDLRSWKYFSQFCVYVYLFVCFFFHPPLYGDFSDLARDKLCSIHLCHLGWALMAPMTTDRDLFNQCVHKTNCWQVGDAPTWKLSVSPKWFRATEWGPPIWWRKYAIVKFKESDEAPTMEKKKLSNYANETSMSDQIIQYMTCHKLLYQLWIQRCSC
jgi:hypothetical protein